MRVVLGQDGGDVGVGVSPHYFLLGVRPGLVIDFEFDHFDLIVVVLELVKGVDSVAKGLQHQVRLLVELHQLAVLLLDADFAVVWLDPAGFGLLSLGRSVFLELI